MDKKLIIGVFAVATAGVVIGGYMMSSGGENRSNLDREESTEISAEDQQKIEDLYWDELRDKEKYSFCLGEARIDSNYTDPILNSNATIQHYSKELLLYRKEENRFYIVWREIDYKYNGTFNSNFGGLSSIVPFKESGKISEYYSKNEMPVRLDYGSNYIFTSPDTEKKKWVYSVIGEETEMVDANIGCQGVFTLDGTPGNDLLFGGEQILIDKACSISDPVGNYVGDFSYSCVALDYNQALETVETAKIKEELDQEKMINVEVEESQKPEINDASAGSSNEDFSPSQSSVALPNSEEEKDGENPSSEDIQKLLEEMKGAADAAQTGQ